MASFRFIHAADIHLDSPLCGLAAYPGAPVDDVRAATRRALANLVDLAETERVDFMVIAGDLYDGDWKDFQTGLFFTHQMARLGRAGIPVVMVLGNHDAQAVITRSLPRQDHVRVLSAKRPDSVTIPGLDVIIHGQSFATRATTDNLAQHYPKPVAGSFNIGLLHTALSGRPGHESYAPCRLEQLVNHGYHYWALGHVHAREVVHTTPHVVFPGNLQGRHIHESGAKGASVVTVVDGVVDSVEHRPLDVMRWATISADMGRCDDRGHALAAIRQALAAAITESDGRVLAVRVRLIGASACHAALVRDRASLREDVRAIAADVSPSLWVEKVEAVTRPVLDGLSLRGRDDAIGELLATIDALAGDAEAGRALLRGLDPLLDKLPAELRDGLPGLGDDFAACLSEIEDMLLSALAAGESS